MKKKKLKKMINELKKKSERELDVEVNILTNKINSLVTSDHILEEKIKLIDERTIAMDNVKVQKTLDKTKELDSKIKILMDRTSVDYLVDDEVPTPEEIIDGKKKEEKYE